MAQALQRQWDKRVGQWHSHVTSAAAFEKVLTRVVELARPGPADACVGLGAGTGFEPLIAEAGIVHGAHPHPHTLCR